MSECKCCEGCRREFRVKNLFLQHDNPQTFVQFQFGYQKIYLAWRLFWAFYHIAWFIGCWVDWLGRALPIPAKWLIFLSNWAYLLLTLSAIVDAVVVLYVFCRRTDVRKGQCIEMPWYLQMHWCMFVLSHVSGVTVTIGYWAFIYRAGSSISAINVNIHMINTIYVILNVCVTGTPIRLLHVWYTVVFGVAYSLFTLVYHLASGTNHNDNPYVYSVLNWSNPGTAVLYSCLITFVVVPFVHVVLYGIHCIKLLIHSKCCVSGASEIPSGEIEMKEGISGGF